MVALVSEPQAVATGSSDCGLATSDCGLEDSAALNPQSEIRDPQSDDPVATARGSDTKTFHVLTTFISLSLQFVQCLQCEQ